MKILWISARIIAAGVLGAGSGILSQESRDPMPHDLGVAVATSKITFAGEVQAVTLGGGRVLVAEPDAKLRTLRVRVFDSSLTTAFGILDSAARSKAGSPGYILPYRGDSALLFDNGPTPGSFLVVAPDGQIVRTMAAPAPWGRNTVFAQLQASGATSSRSLGLFYRSRGTAPSPLTADGRPAYPAEGQPDTWAQVPVALMRMSFETRQIDTVALLGATNDWMILRHGFDGTTFSERPFPFYDEAVATIDGSVAIFHAREYRIEWILPNGTRVAGSQPLTYPWKRISDDTRQHLLDSINGRRMKSFDSVLAQRAADSARTGSVPLTRRVSTPPGGGANVVTMAPAPPPRPPLLLVPAVVPDFFPPTTGYGQVLADADGNVWIRPAALQAADGVWVWEIVNREKGLIDRVRIPENRTVVGFGPGGFVYLVVPDGGVSRLQKVRVR